MTEALIFDAVRTPRGRGRADGSLHEVNPVNLLGGLMRDFQRRLDLDTAQVEDALIAQHALHFSNYEFHFADALRVGDDFSVTVKNTIDKSAQGGGLSNRIVLRKAAGDLVLMGTQSETAEPRFLPEKGVGDAL